MNLYWRLLLAVWRGFFKSRISLLTPLNKTSRVMLGDLDINGHMNNGRYLTLTDLCVVEILLRSNILQAAIKLNMKPVFSGHMIFYKKQLKAFEKYTLDYEIQTWDDRWTYCKFTYKNMQGKVVATGYSRGAWIAKGGMVSNVILEEKLGLVRPSVKPPEEFVDWLAARKSLRRKKVA